MQQEQADSPVWRSRCHAWVWYHCGGKENVSCKRYLWLFSFLLPCPFSKTFDGFFLRLLVGAFIGAFLGVFGVEFSFAFVFCLRCKVADYTFSFTLASTQWEPMAFILLLGGIVRDGLLSGSAAALQGWVRAPRAAARRLAQPGLVWNEPAGSETVDVGKSTWRRW